MKESDWKTFRKIIPEIREAYLQKVNKEITELLGDEKRTPTERFWDAEEKIRKHSKILQRSFDMLSRSRMNEKIIYMIDCGVLPKDRLNEFSDELRERILNTLDICNL